MIRRGGYVLGLVLLGMLGLSRRAKARPKPSSAAVAKAAAAIEAKIAQQIDPDGFRPAEDPDFQPYIDCLNTLVEAAGAKADLSACRLTLEQILNLKIERGKLSEIAGAMQRMGLEMEAQELLGSAKAA